MTNGKLHQLIEQSKWDELSKVLQSNAESLVADAKVANHHGGDLPLHMTCATSRVTAAPCDIVLSVLQLYPAAAQHKGRGNNTPLHLAVAHWTQCSNTTNTSATTTTDVVTVEDTIEALIRAHPEALEQVNNHKLTPRDIVLRRRSSGGRASSELQQLLERPTACWHQIMEDEVKEEQVDAALDQMMASEQKMKGLFGRLEQVEGRLEVLESSKYDSSMTQMIQTLQESVREDTEMTILGLTTVEDDIKAASAREFMAKAASRAYQSDVMRMQKKTGEAAKQLLQQIERVCSELVEVTHQKSPLSKTNSQHLPKME